ncbi:MAG TPA: YggT family protein [Pyrinomonadaceae bacterium]|nr:YggT family protein [Pyrinomonadaceae bacterium]
MIVITRTFLFVQWAVVATIIAVIALMVIRLIADAANLNPFSRLSLLIRQLSDPFVLRMRRGLMGFGIDPKYSPIVVILITILLGFFVLQLAETLARTTAGLLDSVRQGAMVSALGFIIYGAVSIYIILIFMRIVFSWGMVSYTNRLMRFLVNATEPLLGPLRRIIPPLGMLDISPIVAFLILWLFQQAIAGTLLRGAGQIPL